MDPPVDSPVMQEEIFGPILPIITVSEDYYLVAMSSEIEQTCTCKMESASLKNVSTVLPLSTVVALSLAFG